MNHSRSYSEVTDYTVLLLAKFPLLTHFMQKIHVPGNIIVNR